MASIARWLSWLRSLDDLSRLKSPAHAVHPAAAILVAIGYVVAVMSFDRYAVPALAPFLLYPLILFALSDVPLAAVARPLLLFEPFIICIGLFSPWLDREPVMLGGWEVARGWLVFASLVVRSSLAVGSALLLAATQGMRGIAEGMRWLRVPAGFVLQVTLTFRYLWLFVEEAERLSIAYALRSGGRPGIRFRDWGAVVGGLIVRTHERARRVHSAMLLRGFDGLSDGGGRARRFGPGDAMYVAFWLLFFAAMRWFDPTPWLGRLFTGAAA